MAIAVSMPRVRAQCCVGTLPRHGRVKSPPQDGFRPCRRESPFVSVDRMTTLGPQVAAEPTAAAPTVVPFVQVGETHVAVVFLVGDRAYKLKKPVDVGFLDLRTREQRLEICRRELTLNRQFAPDVYLGIADVTDVDGTVCDHLVVMRRMPEGRRLSTLVTARAPLTGVIVGLARKIAAYHATARRSPAITAEGSRDAILGRWRASFAQLRQLGTTALDPDVLIEIERLTEDFLAGREPLFAGRAADFRIVDGHGDLLADDIFCLDDGPRVLDCLEFDDRLRWLDGLDDIAFLAMDLERLGAPELAKQLLERYAEFAADPAPASLREHYLAYRAFVRAKVACLRHAQGNAASAEEAEHYADIALTHLRRGQVRLVLVGGLPGTGKTTVAGALADELGGALLSSDRLRKELADRNPTESAAAPYQTGIYTGAHTERTYAELLHRAQSLLSMGETVVLDASWNQQTHRDLATAVAERTHSALIQLRCHTPSDVAVARLRARNSTASDADPVIAAGMASDTDPWPNAVTLNTIKSPDDVLHQALRTVEGTIRRDRNDPPA